MPRSYFTNAGEIFNIEIKQGATFSLVTRYLEDDETTAIDITDGTAQMQIRNEGTLLADFSTTNGSIALVGTLGKLTITVGTTETATYTNSTFAGATYDYILTLGTVTYSLLRGGVSVVDRVTQ
jgi:hypothetical protein